MKKKLVLSLCGTSLLLAGQAMATNGDQMLGLTAMQWARGGAIVASPVDAPSIMYNPAAAGELNIQDIGFDLGLGLLHAERSISNAAISTDSDSEEYLGLGTGVVKKISDKMYFGLAAGGVAGLGTDFSRSVADTAATGVVTTKGLLKVAPTLSFKPNDKLTIGVSAQLGYQTMAMDTAKFSLPQTGEFGFGGAIGAIYHVSPAVQIGASYISEMDIAEYKFNGSHDADGLLPGATSIPGVYSFNMDAPSSAAFGVAFKPTSKLLIEADVKLYGFADVMKEEYLRDSTGAVVETLAFGWEDQTVYALGVQYAVSPNLTVRAAYNYGETGIDPEDVQYNLGSVATIEHHLSVGITKSWSPNLQTTLSYTHGFENDVTGNVPTPGGMVSHTLEASQDIAYFQLSYRM